MPRTARAARRSAVVAIEPDIDGDAGRMLAQTIVDRGREVAVLLGHVATAVHLTERRAIIDVPTIVIAAATLLVLVKVKKIPEPLVIVAAGLVGLALAS